MSESKQKFTVEGMTCSACVSRVEKAVNKLDGVKSCVVSLITNEMQVTYFEPCTEQSIISAVINAGYKCKVYNKSAKNGTIGRLSGETKSMIKRLIPSALLMLLLMYVATGHMIGLNLPPFLQGGNKAHIVAIIEAVICLSVLIINKRFFVSGIKSFVTLSPNMDALITLGSGASFLYSAYVTVTIFISVTDKNYDAAQASLHNLYYDGSAMIVVFITLGKMLESLSKGRTANAISALMALVPKTATLLIDGKEVKVSPEQVKVGDLFIVKAGESVPCDGVIVSGSTAVDESSLTGESMPVDKTEGAEVYTATVNLNGYFIARATKVGDDTTLSKIIELVKNVSVTKAPIAKLADKVAKVFVPTVISIAIIVLIIWLIVTKNFATSLTHAVAVLVVSCPCALGLATPVAIMVGSGKGAKLGILYKNAESLENVGKTTAVVFDKTGTLTKGQASVTDVIPVDGCDPEVLQKLAVSLERKSSHPLGKAVCDKFKDSDGYDITDFKEIAGKGIVGKWDYKPVIGGNLKLMKEESVDIGSVLPIGESLSKEGKTPLIFAVDGKVIGVIACADELKNSSKDEIEYLQKCGIRVFMLTGDNRTVAMAVGENLGLSPDSVIAEVLPDGKANEVLKLKQNYNVAMVGDGINDAPALTSANTGIAIGAGSNVAVESADMVIVGNDIYSVSDGIGLSKKVIRIVKENLFWAFIYNVIAVPIAAGALSGIGINLSPGLASLCMSLSSITVVLNALRINLYKPRTRQFNTNCCDNNCRLLNAETQNTDMETINNGDAVKEDIMETILNVEGMMCRHCEMHVEKAVSSVVGVKEVKADYTLSKVTLTYNDNVDMAKVKEAIESEGYKVL